MKNPFTFTPAIMCLLIVLVGNHLCAAVAPAQGEGTRTGAPATMVTYTGAISKIENKNTTAIANFTVTVDEQTAIRVHSAPGKYLTRLGVTLTEKQQVTVSGTLLSGSMNAYTLTIDGKTYQLRNDDGSPKWTYWDVYADYKEVSGEVTKVQVPSSTTATGAPGQPTGARMPVTLIVTSADKTYTVVLAPQSYLEQIKFTPAVGMKITLTGWMPTKSDTPEISIYAQQIKVDDQVYTFRGETGLALWEANRSAVKKDAK